MFFFVIVNKKLNYFRVPVDKSEVLPEKKKSDMNPDIEVVNYGEVPHDVPLQVLTTYPQGAGFPFFTWAQLFFTNANHVSL